MNNDLKRHRVRGCKRHEPHDFASTQRRQCRRCGERRVDCLRAPASTSGLVLAEAIPEAHKVALADLAEGDAIVRYGVPIGYANRAIARGSWVHEGLITRSRCAAAGRLSAGDRNAQTAAAARGLHLRGLSQCRWHRWARRIFSASAPRCSASRPTVEYAVQAHQGRDSAALSECG